MSDFDLKISNGTVANSAETFSADIGVKDGKIVAIGKNLVMQIMRLMQAASMSYPAVSKRTAISNRNPQVG